jgi:transglutaminase-like putative cysteine protease
MLTSGLIAALLGAGAELTTAEVSVAEVHAPAWLPTGGVTPASGVLDGGVTTAAGLSARVTPPAEGPKAGLSHRAEEPNAAITPPAEGPDPRVPTSAGGLPSGAATAEPPKAGGPTVDEPPAEDGSARLEEPAALVRSPADHWPMPNAVHPFALANRHTPASAFAARARALPPEDRVKAVHDWVTLILRYALEQRDQQSADLVLARRTATCDGYSAVFRAVGQAAGLQVETIRGLLKVPHGPPQPHAWNAVHLDGRWQLVDVTLDDPTVRGDASPDGAFRTDYLLVPPAIAALDHWPFSASWQLGAPRLSREAFARAPRVSAPSLVRAGISILTPPALVDGRVVVRLLSPGHPWLLLAADGLACDTPRLGRQLELSCPAPNGMPSRLELLVHEDVAGLFLSIHEFSPR